MNKIKVFILLLRVVVWFQRYLERQDMLEAARKQALKELGESADGLISAATDARAGVDLSPAGMLNDPQNRDA